MKTKESVTKPLFGLAVIFSGLLWLANVQSGTAWRVQPMLFGDLMDEGLGTFLTLAGPAAAFIFAAIYFFKPNKVIGRFCYSVLLFEGLLGLFVHYAFDYMMDMHSGTRPSVIIMGGNLQCPIPPIIVYWVAAAFAAALIFLLDFQTKHEVGERHNHSNAA